MKRYKQNSYKNIAAEIGLSMATISRVINGNPNVNVATREKVLTALANHGYDLASVQSVKQVPANSLIIFNIPSMENLFYYKVAEGAKRAAMSHGFHLLVNEEHINEKTFPSFLDMLHKSNAAGLITTNFIPKELLKKLHKALPMVQCSEYDMEAEISCVSIDNIAATKTVMQYILALKKRHIAIVNGPIRYRYARERLRGYKEALASAGIPIDDDIILQLPEIDYDMAISAITQLLLSAKRPEAFFCVSDAYAAAVIKACSRVGLSVPSDVSVTGFDNIEYSSMVTPTITTVSQPRFQLGVTSCELLVEKINNPHAPNRKIILDTELIIRESAVVR
ncbi:MAG: LacI family DNA-binding transcriptional regulator [Deferribacteraceae bacterium]|jgi:LacI family repressor for deo operon, udp, cdd, tsx, nupC, and nupG|nr:LacI family DNA-binding transcriptional regulator [Deferribacteraceae bacterium]